MTIEKLAEPEMHRVYDVALRVNEIIEADVVDGGDVRFLLNRILKLETKVAALIALERCRSGLSE